VRKEGRMAGRPGRFWGWTSIAGKLKRSFGCLRACRFLPRCQSILLAADLDCLDSGCGLGGFVRASIAIEDQDIAVVAWDFDWLPGLSPLIEPVGLFGFVIVWNPFANRLPGRFDGLEGLDVEGWVGWWRDVDDALPKAAEPEEEFDFAGVEEGAGALHDGLAAGHWSGSAPQTRGIKSRQSGRMARAVTLAGGRSEVSLRAVFRRRALGVRRLDVAGRGS